MPYAQQLYRPKVTSSGWIAAPCARHDSHRYGRLREQGRESGHTTKLHLRRHQDTWKQWHPARQTRNHKRAKRKYSHSKLPNFTKEKGNALHPTRCYTADSDHGWAAQKLPLAQRAVRMEVRCTRFTAGRPYAKIQHNQKHFRGPMRLEGVATPPADLPTGSGSVSGPLQYPSVRQS